MQELAIKKSYRKYLGIINNRIKLICSKEVIYNNKPATSDITDFMDVESKRKEKRKLSSEDSSENLDDFALNFNQHENVSNDQ